MATLTRSASLGLDAFQGAPLALRPNASKDDVDVIITATYRQVLGNIHMMDAQRLTSAESQLRNGDITVQEFVRAIAQSELYRDLFFDGCSVYRCIELNFKHLLGRAPQDQSEISEHVAIYQSGGYAAEINSYIDGEEYLASFGEHTVPYPRGTQSQTGVKNVSFNRMFSLLRGSATSDRDPSARLISDIAANLGTAIKPLAKGSSSSGSTTGKRFQVNYSSCGSAAQLQGKTAQSCIVSYKSLSKTIQNIQRSGGQIVGISAA